MKPHDYQTGEHENVPIGIVQNALLFRYRGKNRGKVKDRQLQDKRLRSLEFAWCFDWMVKILRDGTARQQARTR